MFRPVLPVIEYYLNYDYIAQELCKNKDRPYLECDGRCYLEEQLSKTEGSENPQKPIALVPINLKDYPVSTLDFYKVQLPVFKHIIIKDQFIYSKNISTDSPLSKVFRPPIF